MCIYSFGGLSVSVVAVHNVKKFFGDELILDDVSLQLHPRERVGLVGPN